MNGADYITTGQIIIQQDRTELNRTEYNILEYNAVF